jgi:hypothetical protein
MVINMVPVHVVQMAVVNIVCMVVVLHGGMPTVRAVLV